jgi:hypothetical protein
MVENIRHNNKIIARIIGREEQYGKFKFFSEDKDALQIARWNHPKGYECKAHIHNVRPKTIYMVEEAIFVLSGELEVTFCSPEGEPIAKRLLHEGDICHTLDCGHGYKVLTDDTRVFEFKNGPFPGEEEYDKERTLMRDLMDPNNFYAHEQI